MQRENMISFDALITATSAAAAEASLYSRSNPFLSPSSPDYLNSSASLYSSLFGSYSPNSISDTASYDGGGGYIERLLQDTGGCILEYQQLFNRYTLCLSQIRDSVDEVDALRRENESLRLTNADLSRRVALLFSRDRLLSQFNRLNTAASPSSVQVASTPHPLSELNCVVNRRNTERVSLPKSISVRSKAYLKMTRPGQDTVSQPDPELQRVYAAAGAEKLEEELEFDVYNQGMSKTELCNKWQETGACPYGENCQFAHGINELRPVIRHPRYKTEVCRMVLSGDTCPYGHRCHFRHSLTDQERLMAAAAPPHRY
ncbi:hypothetical protein BUALT_Bualt04G0084000 [Buddleja alternifolia]|uniref:C3H1-type domain-containing protein n=1 Tax=Buddleja alternifolia TaxID=168488 RepID=A0AAV6XMB3_9LAMI|nr:hypothetical protein BUALT_Bualt04G0084000 [Buddleja alternifolia]